QPLDGRTPVEPGPEKVGIEYRPSDPDQRVCSEASDPPSPEGTARKGESAQRANDVKGGDAGENQAAQHRFPGKRAGSSGDSGLFQRDNSVQSVSFPDGATVSAMHG